MKEFGLRALSYAWRAQQDQTPRVTGLARSRAFGGRSYEPGSPIVLRGRVHEYTGSWNLKRLWGCARDSGYRGRFFDFVTAVTIACEGWLPDRMLNPGIGKGEFAQKTKRPRLKESRDARPNSPPPSAAREQDYRGGRNMGMAPMGYSELPACRLFPRK